jgi:cytochrome c oxidase cbb3-type subunit 4
MDTYSWMREFADSWMLLALTLFYLGAIIWALRPGSRETHRETADIPFRNETICKQDCATCRAAARSFPEIGGKS